MTQKRKCKLPAFILELAATSVGGFFTFADIFLDPYKRGEYHGSSFLDRVAKRSLSSTINRLKNQGYLEKIEKKGRIGYMITEKGRSKIDRFLFDREVWDGRWRMVVFDIPEEKKKLRDFFRGKLSHLGFKQLQKSVWVTPFDVLDDIEEIINEYGLGNYIWYFLANSLADDEEIIEKFLLKKG